jgi:hypothetical protein
MGFAFYAYKIKLSFFIESHLKNYNFIVECYIVLCFYICEF